MHQDRFENNIIVRKSFEFAVDIINYCEELILNKKYIVYKQLGKSGTSIGANVFEAQNAESRNDFIHKMKIAAKEGEETQYWLKLCSQIQGYPNAQLLLHKLDDINKILAKIISSSKR